MAFGDWLKTELLKRDMSQSKLARATGRSTAAVNRWIKNLDIPTLENIGGIARALGLDIRVVAEQAGIDLPGEKPTRRSRAEVRAEFEATEPVEIPIIKDLVAHMGAGGGFIDDYIFLAPQYRARRRKGLRGIVARGTCMEPEIMDGDAVIFDLDTKAKPGDRVVAVVDGHVLVRRLIEIAGRLALRADADGETHVLDGEDEIYGTVLGVQRMFPI
jgi:phage repressor protein C with HTH and peptisase S24 domain